MNKRFPVYFISHGGGPWPWLKKEMPFYDELEKSLAAMPSKIKETPKAILMISAHWEEQEFAVMTNAHPPMLYDYGGFPKHTYEIQYPAPGAPIIAQKTLDLIRAAGLPVKADEKRGFDHGTFTPLAVIYPKADVPVFQLSLRKKYDPVEHIALGRAIKFLREEGVLIIGSGLSYHNLRDFGQTENARVASKEFDKWLNETVMLTSSERNEKLKNWSKAPSAKIAHPREDHLVPLFVCVGAAEDEVGKLCYHEDTFMNGLAVSSFKFG